MPASYFQNLPQWQNNTTSQYAGSNIKIQPFVLPYDISASLFRVPIFWLVASVTTGGTSVNTTFTARYCASEALVLYSQGTGASSNSLMSMFSTVGAFTADTVYAAAAVGSNYTVSIFQTFPPANLNLTLTTDSGSYAVTSGTYNLSTTGGPFTRFNGSRFFDFGFSTSLSAGNYWFAIGHSYAVTTGGVAGLTNAANYSPFYIQVSQSNLSFGHLGAATNATIQFRPGLGLISTNASIMTTGDIPLNIISAEASHLQIPIQIIGRA